MLDKASQSLHGPMWTYHSQYYWFVRSHWLRLSGDPNAGMAVDLLCEYISLHQYSFIRRGLALFSARTAVSISYFSDTLTVEWGSGVIALHRKAMLWLLVRPQRQVLWPNTDVIRTFE